MPRTDQPAALRAPDKPSAREAGPEKRCRHRRASPATAAGTAGASAAGFLGAGSSGESRSPAHRLSPLELLPLPFAGGGLAPLLF
eukprot:13745155-Alexandrium_andersonii.AAC.1